MENQSTKLLLKWKQLADDDFKVAKLSFENGISYKEEVSKSLTKQKVAIYINQTEEVLKWLEVESIL